MLSALFSALRRITAAANSFAASLEQADGRFRQRLALDEPDEPAQLEDNSAASSKRAGSKKS
jgi:hypothetical protein